MIESKTRLSDENSLLVDEWMIKHRKETGEKVVKPDAINLILGEYFGGRK